MPPDSRPTLMMRTKNLMADVGVRTLGWLESETGRYLGAIIAGIVLVTAGIWGAVAIRQNIQDIRAAELRALLDAETHTLRLWFQEVKVDAERWAADDLVQQNVIRLVEARQRGLSVRELCLSTDNLSLIRTLQPRWKSRGGTVVNAIDKDGFIIASTLPDNCGRRVHLEKFRRELDQVFSGKTLFIRPYAEFDRLEDPKVIRLERPSVWLEVPVRDRQGRVMAALGFGEYAYLRFGSILGSARLGETGESYAFDDGGSLLSNVRHLDRLREAGLLGGEVDSPIQRLSLRDPGVDLLAGGERPEMSSLPLTLLIRSALSVRGDAMAAQNGDVILKPYRNYLGQEVIGAWRWLTDMDLGLAVEIGAGEAYSVVGQLNKVFFFVYGTLILSFAGMAVSSFTLIRLWRELSGKKLVGPYRIEKQVGEGGMANVYLAYHALLKRPTAIKILKPHKTTDEVIKRFEREVRHAAHLTHPNTVEIYDYGRTKDGRFFYAMEYLEGITLSRLVEIEGPVSQERVAFILRQICASLNEMHRRGMVHRDIKPENIMLCERGGLHDVVKVLDLGLVKDIHGNETRHLTRSLNILGTPAYMSPERIRNPADADARSDIYAVGAVGFYLLTGRTPFIGESDFDITNQILHGDVPGISTLRSAQLDAVFEGLILRCLSKSREDRPGSALAMMAELDGLSFAEPWSEARAIAWWEAFPAAAHEGLS